MFYDRFITLCAQKGISPSKAAVDAGLSKSTVSKWKSNPESMPTGAAIEKLKAYFGVSTSELLGEKEKATIDVVDDDLREYLDTLRERPEMRMLFSTTKTATKEQIEAIVHFIEGMQK